MAVRPGYTKSELAALAEQVTVDIRAYLVDLVAYSIARGSVSLDTTLGPLYRCLAGRAGCSHQWFATQTLADRERLLAALEAPEVGRLIERYAFQALDPQRLRYLSNLLEWREKTILVTLHSEYKDDRC